MISVINVYNNSKEYDNFLNSLKEQNIYSELEIIGINNTTNHFRSAAAALNYGATQAKGDTLIFSHQDIEFLEDDVIQRFAEYVKNSPDALVGVAGYGVGNHEKYSTLIHGKECTKVGKWHGNESETIEIETADECFFGMKRIVWEKYRFNEEICDNWHLYAVEFALRIRIDGLVCLCVPAAIWHKSTGNMNSEFYKGVKRLIKIYKHQYPYLYTTCVQIRNTKFGLIYFRLRKKMGRIYYQLLGRKNR